MLDQSKLEKYNQEHLSEYEKLMSNNEKEQLENKVESLDLEFIQNLYQDLYVNRKTISDVSSVSEVEFMRKAELTEQEREKYESKGIEAIRNGEFAVLLWLAVKARA